MSKRVAFIFPGQGSQSIGMGKDFYDNDPLAKEIIDAASASMGIDFPSLLFQENETINETAYTQPAILLVSMVAHTLFSARSSIVPTLLLGHSLGEFSAVCAAGALSIEDAVKLVNIRGRAMQEACSSIDAGMMAIVGMEDSGVEAVCAQAQSQGKKVWPANYNQEGQLVIAGLKSDLQSLEATFKEAGAKRALLLNMSVASHCPLQQSAQVSLTQALEKMLNDNFIAPIISNVTTKPYQSKEDAITLLAQQLVKPVLYKQSIEAIAGDIDVAIEFGNGKVLSGLNKRIAKDLTTYNVYDMASLQQAIDALA
ncbi:MAG: malonyl CoA-ACP transacylase [Sulfuricurvum sp. PC08-66]|nr:MAG: malonyl CoA-ACP transacylase [Sulfuricurvum sp. PC08-66]